MRLTRIDISEYKSIKRPLSVAFDKGRAVTFIGKNGSGKTNILDAIKYALSDRNSRHEKNCKIQYHIELSDEDMEEYFSCVVSSETTREIVVDRDNNPKMKRVSAAAITIAATRFKEQLDGALAAFSAATEKYIDALREIEAKSGLFGYNSDVHAIDKNSGSIVYFMQSHIDRYRKNALDQIGEIKKYIDKLFDGDKITLERYGEARESGERFFSIPFYQIPDDVKIAFSPVVANSLGIDEKGLEQANVKLNENLKELNALLESEYGNIKASIDQFEKTKRKIANIFAKKDAEFYDNRQRTYERYRSVLEKINDVIAPRCYYLDNENTLLFLNLSDYEDSRARIRLQKLNSYNPIATVFDEFLKSRGLLGADFTTRGRGSGIRSEQQARAAVKALNNEFLPSIMPTFDNGEIIKFEVKYEDGDLNLYIHEKTGDVVSFNNTSLGRRWYLTYRFVRALLKPDDILLVDEPAAFLHPQAQTEFKAELDSLAQSGVYVFYTTHSPYMIPENWGYVYNVTMTDEGTKISGFESSDELYGVIQNELGVTNTANILFNLGKTLMLVEGIADKLCIEKFAELLGRDLSGYYIQVCDGDAILLMAYMLLTLKTVKIKVVLDNDNKYKGEEYGQLHSMYSKCIEVINANPDCRVYIGKGEKGCLEDLFVDGANERYMKYKKNGRLKVNNRAVAKLKNKNEVSNETLNNFENLFNRLGVPKRSGHME